MTEPTDPTPSLRGLGICLIICFLAFVELFGLYITDILR